MEKKAYLMYVGTEHKSAAQSNKFYNMTLKGDVIDVEYGRVGQPPRAASYPADKWDSLINSKVKKGYKDITDLKATHKVVAEASNNTDFDTFYSIFSKYTGQSVSRTYLVDHCSQGQIDEAQKILDKLNKLTSVKDINKQLTELYSVIPRTMSDVRAHLVQDVKQLKPIIAKEQDAIDSMDSSNIMHKSNPFKELGLTTFKEVSKHKEIEVLINKTLAGSHYKIHKIYEVTQDSHQKRFDDWLESAGDKHTEYLIHGTRNPNIFSILKSGLLIRPTNAAMISGAAYGNGIYHSAHAYKSLGYTGWDKDAIFFIQNVHMGKYYTYNGWYSDGKDISRSQMSYKGLKQLGYDSLYVKPGDGLMNSEYIVYNTEQTVTNYLVWLK